MQGSGKGFKSHRATEPQPKSETVTQVSARHDQQQRQEALGSNADGGGC
jgi:hypothetical protein